MRISSLEAPLYAGFRVFTVGPSILSVRALFGLSVEFGFHVLFVEFIVNK